MVFVYIICSVLCNHTRNSKANQIASFKWINHKISRLAHFFFHSTFIELKWKREREHEHEQEKENNNLCKRTKKKMPFVRREILTLWFTKHWICFTFKRKWLDLIFDYFSMLTTLLYHSLIDSYTHRSLTLSHTHRYKWIYSIVLRKRKLQFQWYLDS